MKYLRTWVDHKRIWYVFVIVLASFMIPNLEARTDGSDKQIRTVVASTKYEVSGIHRWFLGKNYRKLWITPIEVEVLDLQNFAGGLQPLIRVGGMQTLGLALKGADGRSYTFRGVEKDPKTFLPTSFQDTLAERLIKDQTSAALPGVAVSCPSHCQGCGDIAPSTKTCGHAG